MYDLLLYVVYHDENSLKMCYKELSEYSWIKFVKIETTKYCESIFLLDYLKNNYNEWKDHSYVGMITYSFSQKIHLSTVLNVYNKIKDKSFNDYDIIGLRKVNLTIGDNSHIGMTRQLIDLINKIPSHSLDYNFNSNYISNTNNDNANNNAKDEVKINTIMTKDLPKSINYSYRKDNILSLRIKKIEDDKKENKKENKKEEENKINDNIKLNEEDIDKIVPFYSNYWVCKKETLKQYLNWLNLVKKEIEDSQIVNENSRYKVASKDFIPIFGYSWMTWHPFIMERMICIYAYLTKAKLYVYETNIKPKNNKLKFG